MAEMQKPPLIWTNLILFVATFLVAAIAVPWYGLSHGYSAAHWWWLLAAFSFANLSITAGYHRLWSHKAYQAHPVLRVIFAIGGALALQNSVLHWSSDHRIHHRHVDNNDKDPYSAKRGLWYSHIGWMLRNYHGQQSNDYSNCRDLQKDAIVMWQHRHYLLLAIVTNLALPIGLGLIYGDVLGMVLVVGVLRLVLTHHTTFFINSLAHFWGSQPFTSNNTARDNPVLAVFTFGEGYHNFHHLFENDYRNGIYWWQYDPTKWLIKSGAMVGLCSKLRMVSRDKIEKARYRQQMEGLKQKLSKRADYGQLATKLQGHYEQLLSNMSEYYDMKKRMMELKKQDIGQRYERAILKARYRMAKARLAQQKRMWRSFAHQYA